MSNCGTILAEPTTTTPEPTEPRITPLGDGVFRVGIPGTNFQTLATTWTLPDAILAIAAVAQRAAKIGGLR